MKLYLNNWKIWIIALIKLCYVEAQNQTDKCNGDVTRRCGTNISQSLCEARNCCYMPSRMASRVYQCVEKRANSRRDFQEHREPPPEEIAPPDAAQVSLSLKQQLDEFTDNPSLAPREALGIANSLETNLKFYVKRGDKINWQFFENGIIDARIQADPSTFDDEVRFASGTSVRVKLLNRNSWNDISALLLIEYYTIGNVWKNTDKEFSKRIEEKRDECGSTFRVTDRSAVLSVKVFDQHSNEVKVSMDVWVHQPIQKYGNINDNKRLACTVLNEATVQWSPSNCVKMKSEESYLSCNCKLANTTRRFIHSSASSLAFEESTQGFSQLQILGVVMEGLAFVFLLMTLFSLIFTMRRRKKSVTSASARIKERTMVHINFVVALAALHFTNFLNELLVMEDLLCNLIVVFSHYFTLTSAMWMLMECLTFYINITKKKTKHVYLQCIKILASWGMPAIIVIISAAIGMTTGAYINFKKEKALCNHEDLQVQHTYAIGTKAPHCALSTSNHMIWSVAAPLLAIFVANFLMIAHTIGFVVCWLNIKSDSLKLSNPKSQGMHHVWHATKGILVLFPILGVPWLIGYFLLIIDYQVNIAFQYAYVVLNGTQGIMIFVLYCVLNQETYNIFFKNTRKRRNKKIPKVTTTAIKSRTRRKSTGGQINPQQPYYHMLQRPRSASFSTNSTHFRWKTKRSYSFTSTDPLNLEGIQVAWSRKSLAELVRSRSTKSLCAADSSRPSLIPGLNLEPGEPTMISFNYDEELLKSQTLPVLNKLRWHRMIPKDFKRFSVIPEELKRGGGIESLVIENSDAFSNRKSQDFAIEEVDPALNVKTVRVDVHINDRIPRIPYRSHKLSKHDSRRNVTAKHMHEKKKNSNSLRFRDTKVYNVNGRHFDCYEV